MVTIHSFLLELNSFVKVSEKDITKAEKSKIKTTNNPNFKNLVKGWENGRYDEDPQTLYFEVANLLDKEKL